MDHVRLRRLLDQPLAAPAWPSNVRLTPFTQSHAPAVHALLALSYANGGGSVCEYPQWWENLSTDSEYDPHLCFTAFSSGALVGVAQCWASGYVKDLAVHPGWRRKGIAAALLLHTFHTFRMRGAQAVDLKVESGNFGAIALYQSLGMVSV